MSPRKYFAQELEDLRADMIKMGQEVEALVSKTLEVVIHKNEALAQEVIEKDDEIDKMEVDIQRQCVLLIAKEQPLAKDLRLIMSVIKIVTDMERIADQCEDICAYSLKLKGIEYSENDAYKRHIEKMAKDVQGMLQQTLASYSVKDEETMRHICEYDDKIDEEFTKIWQEIIEEMRHDASFIPFGPHYIMIIKYLERIADHTTNIAEWMIYNLTGEYTL